MKKKSAEAKIEVQGATFSIVHRGNDDYISLTDIARYKNPERSEDLVPNWLRSRNILEFLGIWELLHNPGFNSVEFDGIKMQAGLNSFTLTPKQWIEKTGAIGVISKTGRYGGTYAHEDVAFEFASWVSIEFKLYLIKEFQRLKEDENRRLSLAWNLNRTLAKIRLPHPHRCYSAPSHPERDHRETNHHHLRQRSRRAQCRPSRPDRP